MGDMKIVSQGIADAQKATSDGGRKVSVAEAKNIITHAQAAGVSDSDIKSGFKHAGPQLEKAYAEAVKELSKAPASSAADKAMISVMSSDGGSDPRPAKDIVNQQWDMLKGGDHWEFSKQMATYDHNMIKAGAHHIDASGSQAQSMVAAAEIDREVTTYCAATKNTSAGSVVVDMVANMSKETRGSEGFKEGLTNAAKNPVMRDSMLEAYKQMNGVKVTDSSFQASADVLKAALTAAGVQIPE